jgi:hypothetical protein
VLEDAGALLELLSQVLGLPCHRGLFERFDGPQRDVASRVGPDPLARAGSTNIVTIGIPRGTVPQYEQAAIAREAVDHKEFFEERAAILGARRRFARSRCRDRSRADHGVRGVSTRVR